MPASDELFVVIRVLLQVTQTMTSLQLRCRSSTSKERHQAEGRHSTAGQLWRTTRRTWRCLRFALRCTAKLSNLQISTSTGRPLRFCLRSMMTLLVTSVQKFQMKIKRAWRASLDIKVRALFWVRQVCGNENLFVEYIGIMDYFLQKFYRKQFICKNVLNLFYLCWNSNLV